MSKSREQITYCKLTPILGALLLCAGCAYVYFLNVSVVHVVLQKERMSEIQELRNEIALLEADYIAAQHTIAARLAEMDELEEDRVKLFVSRDAAASLVISQ